MDFSKKLGPLPLWGWLIAAVVVYYGVEWWRHRSSGASTTTTASTPISVTRARTATQYPMATGRVFTPNSGSIIGTTAASNASTGESWIQRAQAALMNLGYTPTSVDKALQSYASGQSTTSSEHDIITAAEKIVGGSPLGSPPNPTSSGSVSGPGYGIVPTKLGTMVWLGTVGQATNPTKVYNVTGGAPVFFGNATSLAQGAHSPGSDIYVPEKYGSFVTKTPAVTSHSNG